MASYVGLFNRGVLDERVEAARARLISCTLCPRCCGVNRNEVPGTLCRTGARPVVSAWHAHFGEEAPLVGRNGSGTIFFGSCSLGCVFCQNWTISRLLEGREVTPEDLARVMIALERSGCHNINLVTPTHMVPQILGALRVAIPMGLSVPLVYNTGGYDSVETLRLLDGVVDIYMPDIKFLDGHAASRYCAAEDYPAVVRAAVLEMHRQVGDLVADGHGVATRGLLVRHLVMPGRVADTRQVCRFLAQEVSRDTYLNLMDQYRPCGMAAGYPEIARRITRQEFDEALRAAGEEGLRRAGRS